MASLSNRAVVDVESILVGSDDHAIGLRRVEQRCDPEIPPSHRLMRDGEQRGSISGGCTGVIQ